MGNISSCLGQPPAPAETSSRCATPTATAAHNFIVENYSLLNGMGVGKFVSSTTFVVGGNNCNIRFYPDGDGQEPAGYASAFLHLVGEAGATGVKAKFTLSLLAKDGKVYRGSRPVSIAQTFETGGVHSTWGVLKLDYPLRPGATARK